jgi:threonine/homoserine/homoserine lactone efflux protein
MAKVAHDAARGHWLRGIFVGLGASCADLTLFVLVYYGVLDRVPDPRIIASLALGGVVLMNYFAYAAWRGARQHFEAKDKGGLRGFPGGYVLAMTSPFNWAWWLTSGAPFLSQYGFGLIFGFFPALLITILGVTGLFVLGARYVQGFERWVSYASAVLLFGFSIVLAYDAIRILAS